MVWCKTHQCSMACPAQVRFEYEFHDEEGKWFRAHGNEVSLHLPASCTAYSVRLVLSKASQVSLALKILC